MGCKIAPKDCVIGTPLMHSELPLLMNTNVSVSEEEAWAMGFFMADGSCGKYDTKWGIKYSWAINNACLDYLNQAKDCLEKSTRRMFRAMYEAAKCEIRVTDPRLHIESRVVVEGRDVK